MRTGSKLLRETSMLSDHCVRVPETGRHAETFVDEPENGPIIAVDDDGLLEPITATVAPELVARVRASLRAMKIITMRRSRLGAQ
jgi:hypothetical protein